jgi:hypothetical protein
MGRQIIWDGAGLPEIGDEVLFDVGSSRELQRGKVKELKAVRYDKTRLNCWRIEVHMTCDWAGIDPYPMMRLLEETYPLTFRKEEKA